VGDEQLWEIAFHVMTLREGFDPRPPAAELPLALEDLAVSSNEDLLTWLRALRREAAASDIDFYRLHPPGPRLEPSRAGSPEAPPYAQAEADPGIEAATILENAFGTVAKDAFPSVVGLSFYVRDTSAGRKAKAASGTDGPPGWQNAADGRPAYPGYRLLRAGTGFFVDEDGSILTCHHLLVDPKTGEPAEIIDVEMQNNHHVRARVIGTEPTVNLAVLKAEAPVRWPTAALGDDTPPRVGQWAIALGDPPGIERTFVPGVISAIPERDCYQAERASTMIQTSLRIGAESFGGPIVDIRGRVLGISMPASPAAWIPGASTVGRGKAGTPAHGNDALAETTGSGPVFALPIHLAMTLYEALKVKESRRSPWLGISVLDLWADLPRKTLKSPPPSGVFIDGVFDPSPASRAGIRIQDVLTAMDGNRVSAVQDFQRWLYLLGIGMTITLEIFRNGEILEKRVTIEERPAAAAPRE
jgi:S1-C subfamily serine protease